ncbi:MAG: DUF1501 domain-containing protein [Bacteroidota bacterium]
MNYQDKINELNFRQSRRDFFKKSSLGFGALALGQLLNPLSALGASSDRGGVLGKPHFAAKAKRVIYLFQSGGPSQIELFDYKPLLKKWQGEEIPDSVRGTQRNSGMVTDQSTFPLVSSIYDFKQYGQTGTWMSELLPYTSQMADELCVIRSMYTEAINHEPAVIFMQTGSQINGRPSIGSWLSYGLGSSNENLPAFVVLISKGGGAQPLSSHAWGSGFLPSYHQGVQFRSSKDPVLYLNNPPGMSRGNRKEVLSYIEKLNQQQFEKWGDPEIESKIQQYEMAFRMQLSVPEVVDISKEPQHILDMYGPDVRKPGSYAANCLLARKLAEQDVKFIQLYHMGWDQHGNLPSGIKNQTQSTDQATTALLKDLKQRGLLDDTLVIWGGEFGRTSFSQGRLTKNNYGRDHHPGCYTMWMAGAGVKKGISYGETDEFSYNVVKDGVHVHDFQATLLHLLGIDHERLVYKYQGRKFRLTDVHGKLVKGIIA